MNFLMLVSIFPIQTLKISSRDSVPALAAGMEQMLAERGRFDPQAIRQAAYNQYDQGVLAKTQLACFRKVLSDRA